ncbi:hypothetical protein FQN60_017347 [Etheostoma spectabile]|uniref:RNA-binding protein 42 n=1 Tax=Etheostoma spectabile TaxID=54343 RepID=A0A5J5DF87_9PERO|nr:hypothetical protein FQN60_017347 [Etheostoma spectabile]
MALKSGQERLKEMEAEMALFEQEVLGGPVPVSGGPAVLEAAPVQQTLEARAASFVGPPPPVFAGPVPPIRPPMLRPAFVPHILQRPGKVRDMVSMVSAPPTRQGPPPPVKPTPSIIQAAPTVYSAPPAPTGHKRIDFRAQRQARMEELAARVAEQQAAVMAAGLLDKKESEDNSAVIGPSMPEPEPPHTEPVESATEDKKRSKSEKVRKCIRTAAGTSWEDASLLEWESDDFRIFCGDLGNEVNDDILARAFSRYPSFLKAKVGKYVGSRPIKLRKSMWKDRNMEVVRKKQKEKKKLGLR